MIPCKCDDEPESLGCEDATILHSFVLTQYRRVTDVGQTDRITVAKTALSIDTRAL